jgi:hypothetical protein
MRQNRSFGIGSALTVIGAVLVLASLPMTWYHAERALHTELTGWGIFTNLRIWLVVAAVLAIATTLLPRGRGVVTARALLGLLAGAPVLRRIISPPDAAVPLDNRVGLYVALFGALAIIVGGLLSFGREVAEHFGWDLPGTGAAQLPPPPAPRPAHGAVRMPAQHEEPIVDAEVVEER